MSDQPGLLLPANYCGGLFQLDRAVAIRAETRMGPWESYFMQDATALTIQSELAEDKSFAKIRDQAERALDIMAVNGGAYQIARQDAQAILWRPTESGLHLHVEGQVHVPFNWGMRVVNTRRPPETAGGSGPWGWSPGFRFFRMGQTSHDPFTAFRDTYLAVEHMLSAKYPRRRKPKREPEADWFARAVREFNASRPQIGGKTWLEDLELDEFVKDVLDAYRNPTFHAKDDEKYLLPGDPAADRRLNSALEPLTRLFLELAAEPLRWPLNERPQVLDAMEAGIQWPSGLEISLYREDEPGKIVSISVYEVDAGQGNQFCLLVAGKNAKALAFADGWALTAGPMRLARPFGHRIPLRDCALLTLQASVFVSGSALIRGAR